MEKRKHYFWYPENDEIGFHIEYIQGVNWFYVKRMDNTWESVYKSLRGCKAYIARKVGMSYQEINYKQTIKELK